MTHDKMFEEIGCPDELKKCKAEIERHKRFIRKQADIIKSLELEVEQKENEIILLKK
jgi:hypothetical protein|tara:strand:+ start:61 stop:231 length:171 start_codon:yes stop_codon:yes gene_type:complete